MPRPGLPPMAGSPPHTMRIRRLSIAHLRNLQADLPGLGSVNAFFGANGSGKTSVLEAIHLLGLGRSFRSPSARSVIAYDQPALTVFAELDDGAGHGGRLGVSRSRHGDLQLRRNGDPVRTLAEVARELPLLLVNADTFALLEGAPRLRRQFLDWGVFHVEPTFYPAWKTAIRCLKHRNSLLRRGKISPPELDAWDAPLAAAAETIHACRERYWQALAPVLARVMAELGVLPGLAIAYAPGWDTSRPCREVLSANLARDQAHRQTTAGPHRADLVFRLQGHPAADTLSRGQKKQAILALRLAQAEGLVQAGGPAATLLLDDLPAELDEAALARVVAWLRQHDHQAFITGIGQHPLAGLLAGTDGVQWFHVEQGRIRRVPPPADGPAAGAAGPDNNQEDAQ